MKRLYKIIVATFFVTIADTHQANDFLIGLGTSFGSYCVAKESQQLWDTQPAIAEYITRDHTAGLVLGVVMIPLAVVYHKNVLAGKSNLERRVCIERYLKGMLTAVLAAAGIEMYINWNTDWSKTLFPTFTALFSNKNP